MKQSALVCALGTGLALMFSAAAMAAPKTGNPDPDRVLIKFKHGSKWVVEGALRGVGATLHYSFDNIDTFAATVPARALEGLRHNPNIELIEPDALRYPSADTVPYGVDLVQARDVWDADHNDVIDAGAPTGDGLMVCVIDSGIHAGHEDFASVDIVGGFPDGKWNYDNCGHGTHVAGTINASHNALGVVGVNPGKASLFIVKVFGDDVGGNCAWSFSSQLIDAANRCADAGARVINMSLGGGAPTMGERRTFDSLERRGVLSIAAAGNGGDPAQATDGYSYPASYDSVVSVAAISQSKALAGFSQKNDQVDLAGPGVNVLSTYPLANAPVSVGGVDYPSVPMTNTRRTSVTAPLVDGGLCNTPIGDNSWVGKVVLCQRGLATFLAKSQNVYNGGGVAAVIYNNTTGALNGTLGTDLSVIPPIPVVGIMQASGLDMQASHLGQATAVNTIIQLSVSNYAFLSGTSMATPHVAGVAAMIWSANPGWSGPQVRAALQATAEDLGAAGRDNSFGWGLVRARDALLFLETH